MLLAEVAIHNKDEAPIFIEVKRSGLRTCHEIHDGVQKALKCLDRWNRIFTIETNSGWGKMEDDENVQWHDKLNDGRLYGVVVVYIA